MAHVSADFSALDERETTMDFLRVVFGIAMFVHLGCLPNESLIAPRQAFQHQAARNKKRPRKAAVARRAAKDLEVDVEEYLYISNISMRAEDFGKSKEIENREEFQAALWKAMVGTKFTLVLGGKNLGKTLIKDHTVHKIENAENSRLTILDVNMRKEPDKPLFAWNFERIENKCQSLETFTQKLWAMIKAIKISLKAKTPSVEVQAEASCDNESPKQVLEEVTKP